MFCVTELIMMFLYEILKCQQNGWQSSRHEANVLQENRRVVDICKTAILYKYQGGETLFLASADSDQTLHSGGVATNLGHHVYNCHKKYSSVYTYNHNLDLKNGLYLFTMIQCWLPFCLPYSQFRILLT